MNTALLLSMIVAHVNPFSPKSNQLEILLAL